MRNARRIYVRRDDRDALRRARGLPTSRWTKRLRRRTPRRHAQNCGATGTVIDVASSSQHSDRTPRERLEIEGEIADTEHDP